MRLITNLADRLVRRLVPESTAAAQIGTRDICTDMSMCSSNNYWIECGWTIVNGKLTCKCSRTSMRCV
ncbi:hypothetical protein Afil01_25050 [Actinorhabdospora filicis]|uniref:Uncharacterized protein n=1 Tax=Actinorhabdospora filicis TaxID=1785913 RepID=A0A9W6SKK3_9ACTN|nr:hypothetical protein [Actinorhabdospora filicis]GLZ77698.1 hypothetical protein Afil01_25050 [Actinorhabdospora filicis]